MSHSFHAFIDESGCHGRQFHAGSSEFLVMSAAIIPAWWEPNVDEIFHHVRLLDGKPKKLQKFSKLQYPRRHRVTSLFPYYPITTCHVILHKPSIFSGLGTGPGDEYAYLIKLTLERISWFVRDSYHPVDPNDGRCAVTFSRNGNLSYDDLEAYLCRLKVGRGIYNCSIDWGRFVEIENFSVEPHINESGLHLGDLAASTMGEAVEATRQIPDDRFIRNIAPTLYRRGNRLDGYGIKFFPSSSIELIRAREHFGFLQLINWDRPPSASA